MYTSPKYANYRREHWGLVLAAGDGTRLQRYVERLKGEQLPNQFVNFVGRRSMLEHTFQRAEKLIPPEKIVTIVGRHHLQYENARRQLSGRTLGTVIVQPTNRETGPGILLPLMHLYKRDPEAIVSIYPSDHFILEEDRFMDHIALAAAAVSADPSSILLLGTEAQAPESEYGYIVPREHDGTCDLYGRRPVARFVEKPAREAAAELIEAGGLWNTMVMVFKVKTVLELFEQINPATFQPFLEILDAINTTREQATIERVYDNLNSVNFSKQFLEQIPSRYPGVVQVLAVLGVFWSDWGSRARVREVRQLLKRVMPSKALRDDRVEAGLRRPLFA